MSEYTFDDLYAPEHPKKSPEPSSQKLQIKHVSEDGRVFIVKHLSPQGGFGPLSQRVRCIRASSLGMSCESDIWMSMNGIKTEFEQQTLNIFDVGTAMEPFILYWMKEQNNWNVFANSRDEEGVIIAVNGGFITGHIDAICSHDLITAGAYGICDAKTMNSRQYELWLKGGTKKAKPGYDVQLETYAYAYEKFLDVRYKVLTAMQKDNSSFQIEVVPSSSEQWLSSIKLRAERILGSDHFLLQDRSNSDYGFAVEKDCRFCKKKNLCQEFTKNLGMSKNSNGYATTKSSVPKLSGDNDPVSVLAEVYELYDSGMNRVFDLNSLPKTKKKTEAAEENNKKDLKNTTEQQEKEDSGNFFSLPF